MLIKRKKNWTSLLLIIALFPLLMFFSVSIMGLFSDKTLIDKIIFLFFLIISTKGLYSSRLSIIKIFSKNPEFELSDSELIIYNNPYFDKIPYTEMIDCKLYHPIRDTLIGITLKQSSEIKSNSNKFQKLLLNVPKDKSKIVFLNLDFADINDNVLVMLLSNKIKEATIDNIKQNS